MEELISQRFGDRGYKRSYERFERGLHQPKHLLIIGFKSVDKGRNLGIRHPVPQNLCPLTKLRAGQPKVE